MRRSSWMATFVFLGTAACTSSQGKGTTDGGTEAAPPLESGTPEAGCAEAGSAGWDRSAVRLDGNDSNVNRNAKVGIDGAGNAVAVWEQESGAGTWTVWASQRTPDGTWSAAAQIDGAGSGIPTEPLPALAVSANGSAVVVFQNAVGSAPVTTNVVYVRYTPGSGWGTATAMFAPVQANQVTGNENPRVAVDSQGNATAVWAQDMGGGMTNADFGPQIYASRAPAGQAFGAPVLLSSYGVNGFTETPDVAVDDQGDAVAAWGANPANMPMRAMGARFDGTSWGTASFLDQGPANANVGILPRVVMDKNKNAVVVWASGQSGGTIGAYSARNAGGMWAPAVQLDTSLMTNLNAAGIRLAIDSSGNATAVWTNFANDPNHPNTIIAARNSGGTWTPAAPIDTAKPGGNSRPDLAVDDLGDVMVVWDDQSNVWAAEYTASGGAFGAEVKVDPGDNSASAAGVAFTHGCPIAITVYQNTVSGNGSEIDSRLFH